MRDGEAPDLEALVKTASLIPEEQLDRFTNLLPEVIREKLLQRLSEIATANAPTTEEDFVDRSRVLLPTLIIEPGQLPEADKPTVSIEPANSCEEQASENVKLVKLHAMGAVGEVYVAFDEQLSRELALKRIRTDLPHDERRFKRFVREAEITAKLQHPGIVPIYDFHVAGESTHYTMPLVSGSNLSTLVTRVHKEIGQSVRQDVWITNMRPLLNHFIAVCNAIDYAHSQRVLHRDIKPENIMIGTQGQTQVLDWGCAKDIDNLEGSPTDVPQFEDEELAKIFGLEQPPGMTIAGSVMGTIEFMSPEQASGELQRIGTHSDVFGLGATLFNLLTNEVAFDYDKKNEGSVERALEGIRRGRHRRIEDVDTRVPQALAAVCHRAMAFEPEDRYTSAGDLGRDIDAFLGGQPVSAYEEPLLDQCMRYFKRRRTLFTTLLGTLLVGFFSLALFAYMANSQRTRLAIKNSELANLNSRLLESVDVEKQLTLAATIREKESKQLLYETEMLLASEASSEPGGFGRMRQLVSRWGQPAVASFRGWEWDHLNAIGNQEFWTTKIDSTVNRIIYTRDSPLARVFDFTKSTMSTIDTDSRKFIGMRALPPGATSADLNRDQSLLAIGFGDGKVRIENLKDRAIRPVEFTELNSAVTDVRWNIGGDYLAASDTSGELVVWQWYERKLKGSGKNVLNIAGKQLLSWSYDGKAIFWTTGQEIRGLTLHTGEEQVFAKDDWIVSPTWSHEGKLLAWIGTNNDIIVLDPASNESARFSGHQLFVETLHWHPHKHYLMSSSADGSLRIWNVDDKKEIRQLLGHGGHVYAASWNSNGTKVVSGGLPEDLIHVWDVSNVGNAVFDRELQRHPAFAWHPNGTQLAIAEGSSILIQKIGGESRRLDCSDSGDKEIFGISFAPDGKRLVCNSVRGRIWTIDAKSGTLLKIYDEGSDLDLFPELTAKSVAWSPDGAWLAGIGAGKKLKIWDEATGKNVAKEVRGDFGKSLVIDWSPGLKGGSSKLAVAGTGDYLHVIEPSERRILKRIAQYGWTTGLAWSPDETKIAASEKRSIRILDVRSATEIGVCEGPSAMIRDISWSGSEDRIAAISEDGMVCIWNADTLAYCAKFKEHNRSPYAIRWSPDGSQLVSTSRHGHVVSQVVNRKAADDDTTNSVKVAK